MKKIILASLCVATALSFTGCVSEEDDIFSASATVRLDEAAETYTKRLSAATGGWAMEYYPTTELTAPKGSGYLLLTKFMPNLSVTVGMKNQFCTPANQYMEDTSSWEVITDNGPVLTFDTYNNCLHVFSSPEDLPSTSDNDETGVGLEGDYEFVMIDVPENGEFITLKGKKRGTYVRLTRLDEGTDFQSYFNDIDNFNDSIFSASAPNVCMLTLGDSIMKMANANTGICNIYPYNGDPISDESYHPYLVTKRNGKFYLRFRDTMTASDGTEVQEFEYDVNNHKFVSVENPSFTIEGDIPSNFFISAMTDDSRAWTLTRNAEMSANIKEKYEALRSALTAAKGTFNNLSFKYENGQYICDINCTVNKQTKEYKYIFTLTPTENGYTFAYQNGADSEANTMIERLTQIKDLLDLFETEYSVEATTTRFNMSTIKLTGANGTELNLTIN